MSGAFAPNFEGWGMAPLGATIIQFVRAGAVVHSSDDNLMARIDAHPRLLRKFPPSIDLEDASIFLGRVFVRSTFKEEQFYDALQEALDFPAYFGRNLDALEECMLDLSWIDQQIIVLEMTDLESFLKRKDRGFSECIVQILKGFLDEFDGSSGKTSYLVLKGTA